MLRVSVPDAVSPSYFVATAAADLGFFAAEGVDAEFVIRSEQVWSHLRSGDLSFVGASPYGALLAFPAWQGVKLLCALAHHTYWFLGVRSDLGAQRGDLRVLRGRRISASGPPGLLLRETLVAAGLDPARDRIAIVPAPRPTTNDGNLARIGADALERGEADAFWGNAMRMDYAVRRGVASVLLDIRRGDGPPVARGFTFPALATTTSFVAEHPDLAAAAVRAIVRTQRALRDAPWLAEQVGRRRFPPEEAELIAGQIARDAEFYDARITQEMIAETSAFAHRAGLVAAPPVYEELVAAEYASLWNDA
jgi:ABC-type nitrate/sulfonate/bicarbonate transport system substrate-binding protein